MGERGGAPERDRDGSRHVRDSGTRTWEERRSNEGGSCIQSPAYAYAIRRERELSMYPRLFR